MNSRERVKRAIHFQRPDHIPHYLPDGKKNDILWLWADLVPEIQPWVEYEGHQRQAFHLLAECGCDGVMGYDDWGLQNRLMVNPALINEFFMPHYRANWQLAHELGMDVWLHSCGYIIDILPAFIEAGLDVIQMDQQENMGLENLDQRVGGIIAFWCPVDIQKTMIDGSVEDVVSYIKQMIATLGNHDGGLISMAYSTPEAVHHTPEKLAAMSEAFRKYGVYGSNNLPGIGCRDDRNRIFCY